MIKQKCTYTTFILDDPTPEEIEEMKILKLDCRYYLANGLLEIVGYLDNIKQFIECTCNQVFDTHNLKDLRA